MDAYVGGTSCEHSVADDEYVMFYFNIRPGIGSFNFSEVTDLEADNAINK